MIDPDTATVLLEIIDIVDEVRQFGDVRSHGARIRVLREQLTAAQHVHRAVTTQPTREHAIPGVGPEFTEICECGARNVVCGGRESGWFR
jgi:hypothetical protein